MLLKKVFISILLVLTAGVSLLFNARYTQHSSILYGDALGYYMYLPSVFIYHNLAKPEQLPEDKGIPFSVMRYAGEMRDEGVRSKKGIVVDQYTYGVACMEMPFFLVAHAIEKAKGLPANGYSDTYNTWMRIATAGYGLLGLLLVYRLLRKYFDEIVSVVAVVILYLGTNLFWFVVYQPGMSHTILFFLYAWLLLLTVSVHEKPSGGRFLLLGMIAGMIVVTRPTDIVCVFIPLCYNVYNKETFFQKLRFLATNKWGLFLCALGALIPFLPQFAYWKMATGQYVFYSYGSQGFHWRHPKIIEGLFYFSNGWLPYAPVMIFAIAGLLLYKKINRWVFSILVVMPIYTYLIYAWYCYNYINGYGSRPMLHMYPLLAIPLAAFIQYIARKGAVVKTVFAICCILFFSVNYSWSMLQSQSLMRSEESNMWYNLGVLYQSKLHYNDLVTLDVAEWQPRKGSVQFVKSLGCQGFEDSTSDHYIPDSIAGTKYIYHVREGEEYLDAALKMQYHKGMFGDAKWFRCSGRFMFPTWPARTKLLLELGIKRGDKFVLWKGCRADNKIGLADGTCKHAPDNFDLNHYEHRRWGEVYYFVKIPDDLKEGDEIILDVWNNYQHEAYVDDLCLQLYK